MQGPPPQHHPDTPLQAGRIVGANPYDTGRMESGDSLDGTATVNRSIAEINKLVRRLERDQVTALGEVADIDAKLDASIARLEGGFNAGINEIKAMLEGGQNMGGGDQAVA